MGGPRRPRGGRGYFFAARAGVRARRRDEKVERVAERLPRFKLQRAEATEPVAIAQLCIDPSARRGAIGFYTGSRSLPEF